MQRNSHQESGNIQALSTVVSRVFLQKIVIMFLLCLQQLLHMVIIGHKLVIAQTKNVEIK